eukprot:TRINITY_DN4054_c0_g2_i1.p1 TRINITY_DN4054_c0_g2~~TRINITY_DN4054_c0_g2_i1.p1  ORF type:complete len:231 (+),score=28.41 TRINITY_DN4054_c0_g2_i1:70-693(+)
MLFPYFAGCGLLMFIIGLPVLVVFSIRYEASVEYEGMSTYTNCTVVEIEELSKCPRHHKITYGYHVLTPVCGDVVLFREDDDCNRHPLLLNSTRNCVVRDDCRSFKWKHQTTANLNSAIVGGSFLLVSLCLFTAAACFDWLHLRSVNSSRVAASQITISVTSPEEVTSEIIHPNPFDAPKGKQDPLRCDNYAYPQVVICVNDVGLKM